MLGGKTIRSGEPSHVALANSWIIINVGGGPTDDKPTVTLETPLDADRTSGFLNIRVSDIQAVYSEWSARGAEFLTPPTQHETELRCYVRDPDRHLIEVGQTALPGAGASSCTADARVAVRDPRQTRATGASWGCSPARVYPGNAIHLESCTGCRAEHAGLLEAAGEFADVTPE